MTEERLREIEEASKCEGPSHPWNQELIDEVRKLRAGIAKAVEEARALSAEYCRYSGNDFMLASAEVEDLADGLAGLL
jgi:hypothetical protein